MVYNKSLYYLLHSCTKSIFGKNLVPKIWGKMLLASQIAEFSNQLYLEKKMMTRTWFFACWYRFMEINSWYKNIGVSMIKKMCGHSVYMTLKLAVSQEEINGINWYSVCWYKFRKDKRHFNNIWVGMVGNGRGLIDMHS